jgi:aryl-alcohol dehydrogenase-like predicted oxidoreductase
MKLALGTAQFGLPYGIANNNGKVSASEMSKILEFARKSGIHYIDTAISYGDCHDRLGQISANDFNIITKLPKLPGNISNIDIWVSEQINQALTSLKVKSIYGILLHNPQDIFLSCGRELLSSLNHIKDLGLVKKIGISIYHPDELIALYNEADFDMVQSPLNPLDQRLIESGWLDRLSSKNVEVHTRSVFLQGLLLMKQELIPIKFKKWTSALNDWHNFLIKNNVNPLNACLKFSTSFKGVSKVIIGVNTENQLREILFEYQTSPSTLKFPNFNLGDDLLINPSKWNLI